PSPPGRTGASRTTAAVGPRRERVRAPGRPAGWIEFSPAPPHEGAVDAPPEEPGAVVGARAVTAGGAAVCGSGGDPSGTRTWNPVIERRDLPSVTTSAWATGSAGATGIARVPIAPDASESRRWARSRGSDAAVSAAHRG